MYAFAPQTPPRLWESGYRERYYLQKFGVDYTDQEFKKKYGILFVTKSGIHSTSLQNHNPLHRGFSLGACVLLPRGTVTSPSLSLQFC